MKHKGIKILFILSVCISTSVVFAAFIYFKLKYDRFVKHPVASLIVDDYQPKTQIGKFLEIDLGYGSISIPFVSNTDIREIDGEASISVVIGDDQIGLMCPDNEFVGRDDFRYSETLVGATKQMLSYQPLSFIDILKVGPKKFLTNQAFVSAKVVFFDDSTFAYNYDRDPYEFLVMDGPSRFLSISILDQRTHVQQNLILSSELDDQSDLWINVDAILNSYTLTEKAKVGSEELVKVVHAIGYPSMYEKDQFE